jgi:hypothetical protein
MLMRDSTLRLLCRTFVQAFGEAVARFLMVYPKSRSGEGLFRARRKTIAALSCLYIFFLFAPFVSVGEPGSWVDYAKLTSGRRDNVTERSRIVAISDKLDSISGSFNVLTRRDPFDIAWGIVRDPFPQENSAPKSQIAVREPNNNGKHAVASTKTKEISAQTQT